jgi:hypothetical protein
MRFMIYEKMTEKAADEISDIAKTMIEKFFADNPKRRVCNARLWYDKTHKIKRANVDVQVDEIRKGIDTVK